jgi:hypothetical protein
MPLITNFRATTIWKAFVLNALVSALIILIAIIIKGKFDNYVDSKGNKVKRHSTWSGNIFTFLFTFLSTFCAYVLMYITFGYGGGMMTK